MASHPATRPLDLTGELTLTGRLLTASNASFVATVATADGPVQVVHKPIRGERELWDFPDGTLAGREIAAHRISAAGGFDVVPFTTLVEGPFGPGATQLWVGSPADEEPTGGEDPDEGAGDRGETADDLVDVVAPDAIPDGWHPVLYGQDERAELVAVVHADDPRLRRLAVFDALINNADRKAGHLLADQGFVLGCDHGLSFHVDDKLRTLLWGWAGEPLTEQEQLMVRTAVDSAESVLAELVTAQEIEQLAARAEQLLTDGLPQPREGGPSVPWPLW